MIHDEVPDNDRNSLPFTRAVIAFGKGHFYPYVEFEMPNGLLVKGFVVPAHLEDQLPSPFDGIEHAPNPLFDRTDESFQSIMTAEFSESSHDDDDDAEEQQAQ